MRATIILSALFVLITSLTGAADRSTPTVEEVKAEILKHDIRFPDIVLAQAIEETGWMECIDCSMDYNNIFGFWYKKKFIGFDRWQESVEYYAKWQKRHYVSGSYFKFLKSMPYSMNPEYNKNLKKIMKSNEHLWKK